MAPTERTMICVHLKKNLSSIISKTRFPNEVPVTENKIAMKRK